MEKNNNKRVLVIGDIHGGFKALQQVLIKAKFNAEKDQLICLGDYVDGWSESAEVVDLLLGIQEKARFCGNGNDPVFIRGNHDEWCNEWLQTGVQKNMWIMQGGQSTLNSYIRTGLITEDSHKKFFRNLHNYYIDENNNGFVHGGYNSRKGLGHEVYQSDYYWDRDLWQLALMSHNRSHEGPPQSNRFLKHKEIFIGHTSTANWINKPHYPEFNNPMQPNKNGPIYIPMNRCNVWNMDTGGGFKGKLSIMDINTKEVWQSDWLKNLYPNEKGR